MTAPTPNPGQPGGNPYFADAPRVVRRADVGGHANPGHAAPAAPRGPELPGYGGHPAPADPAMAGAVGAGGGKRALAYFLDGFIIFVPGVIVILLLGGMLGSGAATVEDMELIGMIVGGIGGILLGIAFALYKILMEASSGQTLGKRMAKIRVVRVDGAPMDVGSAVKRNWWVLLAAVPVLGYLSGPIGLGVFITASGQPGLQAFTDKAAGTMVVRD